MYIYHSTPIEHLQEMQQTGLTIGHETIWLCSDNDCLYFWANQDETIDETTRRQMALYYALQNGQIAAAKIQSTHTRLAVLVYDATPEELEDFPDMSCPNMDGAVAIPIEKIDLARLHYLVTPENTYLPYLSMFYLMHCRDEYMELPPLMHTVKQSLAKSNMFLDLCLDLCMEQIAYILPTDLQSPPANW